MNRIWFQNYRKISLHIRLQLFEALVVSVLLYNSSCWGLRKIDEQKLNTFHRRMLRKICKINWPNKISNKKLYRLTKTKPLTVRIAQSRWRYFGHALRMDPLSPPRRAMQYYFTAEPNTKKFSGNKRSTIVTTLQKDIKQTLQKFPLFQISSLQSNTDLTQICILAKNRSNWRKITKAVTDTVQANSLEL